MRQDKLHPAERRLSPSWSSSMADDFTPWGRDSSRPPSLRKTTSSLLDPPTPSSHATRQIANKQVPSIALSQVLCILNVPGFDTYVGTYEPPSGKTSTWLFKRRGMIYRRRAIWRVVQNWDLEIFIEDLYIYVFWRLSLGFSRRITRLFSMEWKNIN